MLILSVIPQYNMVKNQIAISRSQHATREQIFYSHAPISIANSIEIPMEWVGKMSKRELKQILKIFKMPKATRSYIEMAIDYKGGLEN